MLGNSVHHRIPRRRVHVLRTVTLHEHVKMHVTLRIHYIMVYSERMALIMCRMFYIMLHHTMECSWRHPESMDPSSWRVSDPHHPVTTWMQDVSS